MKFKGIPWFEAALKLTRFGWPLSTSNVWCFLYIASNLWIHFIYRLQNISILTLYHIHSTGLFSSMLASLSDLTKFSCILSHILPKNLPLWGPWQTSFLPVTNLQDGRQSAATQALVAKLKEDYGVGAGYSCLLPEKTRNMLNSREAESLDIQHAYLRATWFVALSVWGSRDMWLEWFQLDFS